MADDPIAAVAEADATGEIAAIFADIRAVYRVGVVNLVWRHLATIPDALPWAWRAIRPVYVDGTVGQAASAFRVGLRPPVLPPIPPAVFAAVGLSADDLAPIRGVLAAYDRTNSMALIALTGVSLDNATVLPLPFGESFASDAPTIPLPALTPLDAMPPHLATLVISLNRFGTHAERPILASMYRHLSHWPAYLGLAWTVLAPLDTSGELHGAIAAVCARAKIVAAGIAMEKHPPPPGALVAIAPFIGDVIPKMVAICGMLHAMTTAPDEGVLA